jgi:GTP-binding protein HflX
VVHVVDASHPDPGSQIQTVRDVLTEVEATDIQELVVFNKCDLIDETEKLALRGMEPGCLLVSAATGEGVAELLEKIELLLPKPELFLKVLVPYFRGDLVSRIHSEGKVAKLEHRETGTYVETLVKPGLASELAGFVLDAS